MVGSLFPLHGDSGTLTLPVFGLHYPRRLRPSVWRARAQEEYLVLSQVDWEVTYGGTLVLELHSFWKTVRGNILCRPRDVWLMCQRERLSGRELRPQVLLDNWDTFCVNNLVENQIVRNREVRGARLDGTALLLALPTSPRTIHIVLPGLRATRKRRPRLDSHLRATPPCCRGEEHAAFVASKHTSWGHFQR